MVRTFQENVPRGAVVLAGCALALLSMACDLRAPSASEQLSQGYTAFQHRAATAQAEHATVYWLGSKITDPSGVTYTPYDDRFQTAYTGAVSYIYGSADSYAQMQLDAYDAGDWAKQRAPAFAQQPADPTSITETTIAGVPAQLREIHDRWSGRVEARLAIIHFPGTVIECFTTSLRPPPTATHIPGSASPDTSAGSRTPLAALGELNPFMDERTFIAVLQHLRPYPQ